MKGASIGSDERRQESEPAGEQRHCARQRAFHGLAWIQPGTVVGDDGDAGRHLAERLAAERRERGSSRP
jgi:hypothetical protein